MSASALAFASLGDSARSATSYSDDAETHPVAAQLTLLAQGDPAERGVCEVILMPSGVWSLTCSETAGTRALVDMVWAPP